MAVLGPELEAAYPGLVRGASVLEAGLNNGNPVIHPPIALLNAARFENEGHKVFFYRDGVSPTVARLIEKLDGERMALLRALGYPAQPDPVTSVEQGYATSTDYFECYAKGPVFAEFTSPNTLDHRYFHEDVGMGLVMFCSLGGLLGVPTPACQAIVQMGSIISGIDYFAQGLRTLKAIGLAGLSVAEIKLYLETGEL
jgi:opine dehydrogenase